jgi:nucleoside-diphosphate-sugar epimerase
MMNLKTNRVLVTGANGFVGTQLCKELDSHGISYKAAVRRTSSNLNQGNCIAVGNIDGQTSWAAALTDVQVVIHLAARVHVMNESAGDPFAEFRAVNVGASLNLARQAVEAGVRRFIFMSSVKVNGEETFDLPFTSFDVPAPLDFYGQSKLEAELALRALAAETGLELVIIRPPLVYGPNVRANFRKLMQFVQLGVPLPLGGVNNRRSMVALDNLVDLVITCVSHPAAANQVFLVSDDDDVSLPRLLQLIAFAMRRKIWLLPAPMKVLRVFARLLGKSAVVERLLGSLQVDITHTKQTLSWKPVVDVEASIKKTVANFVESR